MKTILLSTLILQFVFANDVVAVSAGAGQSLPIRTDGSIWARRSNSFMRLGDGTTRSRRRSVDVLGIFDVGRGVWNRSIDTPNWLVYCKHFRISPGQYMSICMLKNYGPEALKQEGSVPIFLKVK